MLRRVDMGDDVLENVKKATINYVVTGCFRLHCRIHKTIGNADRYRRLEYLYRKLWTKFVRTFNPMN